MAFSPWVTNPGLRDSISAYHWTELGDWFVGTLFVIGVFLFELVPEGPRQQGQPQSLSDVKRAS